MDQVMQFVEPGRQFIKDSVRLVKRCTKPDRKGKILQRTSNCKSSFAYDSWDDWNAFSVIDYNLLITLLYLLPLEFQKIAMATAIGFAIMGFIGFFVKLIHIPINNIIV